MNEDIQKVVEDGLKAVDSKLTAAIEKYEGQIKDAGSVSLETRAEVKALSEEHAKTVEELKGIVQKMAGYKGGNDDASLSMGAQFAKSPEFVNLQKGNATSVRVEVKSTVTSDATTTVVPQYRPGIVAGPFLPLTVRAVLPAASTNSALVIGTREASFVNAAAETAQAAAKPETTLTFARYNVPIETIAHFIKISNQLLQDAPAVTSYIDTRLRYGLEARIDAQLLNGDGASGNISGMLLAGNYTAFTPTTGANLAESINKAKYQLWAAGYMADTVIVNPADWGAMETLKSSGSGEYLWGAPGLAIGMNPFGVRVVISAFMPAGKFLVGGFQRATMLWNRQGDPVEMGSVNDDFTKNLITIRAECRLGLEINTPAALLGGAFTA